MNTNSRIAWTLQVHPNQRYVTLGRAAQQILMLKEKIMTTQCSAAVCAWGTHTSATAVSVHALRAEKSAALLIFLYSVEGGWEFARGLKKCLLKKPRRKSTPPFLIGNVVSIGLILGRNSLLLSPECIFQCCQATVSSRGLASFRLFNEEFGL